MKGYKGFNKDFTCRGKQYKENTVFEEEKAVICHSGLHFCENPFDVLDYYGFIHRQLFGKVPVDVHLVVINNNFVNQDR